ncbi:MAG: M14 family zinc carboxypeptidase [candidate division WOR-3 bacterium]
MKRISIFVVCLPIVLFSTTMWVRVYYYSESARQELLRKNYDILTGNARAGYFEYFLDEEIVTELSDAGYQIEILHPDIVNYLETNYGHLRMTFGKYYTYNEMVQELNQIAGSYPNITHLVSIGQSWQGRNIWAMKISDNPSQKEPEPRVLISAVHHAREPIGCSICMDFIKYLTQNYGTNDTATTIVNNDEVWVVPVVNPDGYVFNETYNDPWGNGWRKNCRDNNNNGQMDTDYDGVDLNRNYGYMWGYDNIGSSPNPPDEDYRGPSAFSEPETQAIRALCNADSFMYNLDYHSYGDYLIYPWGYINALPPEPDRSIYIAMAETMTTIIGVPNNYAYGNPYQTVGYVANGGTFDWMYGDTIEKPKFFAFSSEVGSSFWQGANDTNVIIAQCNETRPMNIYLCYRAAIVGIKEVQTQFNNSDFIIAQNPAVGRINLEFTLKEKADIELRLYDVSGRLVWKEACEYPAGRHNLEIDKRDLNSGLYFLNFSRDGKDIVQRKIVLID